MPYVAGGIGFSTIFCFTTDRRLDEVRLQLLEFGRARELFAELVRRYGSPAAQRGGPVGTTRSASAEWYEENIVVGYIQAGGFAEVAYVGRLARAGGL
jgi:hypothetical protein